MICENCGMRIPDDSEFCQYCGSKISSSTEQFTSAVKIGASRPNDAPESQPIINITDFSNVQGNTDSEETDIILSKKKENKKWLVTVICLSVLILGLAGLNVYQYIVEQSNATIAADLSATVVKLNSTIEEKDNQINSLNSTIGEKDTQIKSKNSELSTLRKLVSSLEDDAECYDAIVDAVKYGNLGYAASNFQSSESIIVVGKSERTRKFTLTANWSNGGTVSVDYDTLHPAAYVDFDQDSWYTSTQMTIEPNNSGVTVVTFSNDVNRQTFDVIIIVE